MLDSEKNFRRTLYEVDYALTPNETVPNAGMLIEEELLVALGGVSGFFQSPDIRVLKFKGVYALPGFIDTHIHGAGGFDATCAQKTAAAFPNMCKLLAEHGVTAFVPTLVSAPDEQLCESLETLTKLISTPCPGAEAVGIQLEGPFISPEKSGAQSVNAIKSIDLELTRRLIAAGHGKIKIWTFAPELENAEKFIKLLRLNNIQPSMGHTVSSADDVLRALDAGATRCAHLYNGMPPLHQRNVSLAAIALTDDRLTAEMILDGTHVDPRMVDLTCRTKKNSLIVGISDAVSGTGMPDGFYTLGNEPIRVEHGLSLTANGTLAGSAQTLERGWSRLVAYAGLENTAAAACFTVNPALSIGLKDRGILSPGKRADIVFYDKETNAVLMTMIRGKFEYVSEEARRRFSDAFAA